MDSERPRLRVVHPDEQRPEEPTPAPTVAVRQPLSPLKEQAALEVRVGEINASVPLNAAQLATVGCRLADDALAIHHQAIAAAPAGTFRKDVPPGFKSAEATRAWLGTHLTALKKKAAAEDAATATYERGTDLKQGVVLAANEVHRAYEAADMAGLKFGGRVVDLFNTARTDLVNAPLPEVSVVGNAVVVTGMAELYLYGCDVLVSLV